MTKRAYWLLGALAGLLLLTGCRSGGEVSPTPVVSDAPGHTSVPTLAPYNALEDPSVVWSTVRDAEDVGGMNDSPLVRGTVVYGLELTNAMENAGKRDLIAFRINRYILDTTKFQLDIDLLNIPAELDEGGALTALIEEYKSLAPGRERSKVSDKIDEYLRELSGDAVGEYTGPDELRADYYESFWINTALEKEKEQIKLDIVNALVREWGKTIDPQTATEEEWAENRAAIEQARQEAESLALENERYQEILALQEHYAKMDELADELMRDWDLQWAAYVRERFETLGLIPVYDLEELDRTDAGCQRLHQQWKALTFVATAEQLREISEQIAEDECITLLMVMKPTE